VFTDKDLDGIVRPIAPLADVGYATAVDSVRARPAQEVAAALTAAGVPTETFGSVAEAFAAARKAASEEDLILVTGSLYTVADARRVVVEEP
jgi:dihydrofolate synthase/folylpolyglutamate synthase